MELTSKDSRRQEIFMQILPGASFKKKDYKSDFIWANKYKSSLEVFCFKNQLTRERFEVALKENSIKNKKRNFFPAKSKIGSRHDMGS